MNAKSKTKQTDVCCGSQCVYLKLARPDAQEVCIAGSFNDWHPGVTRMIRLQDGTWAKELALSPGRYEYRFVVDGEWADDPAATELIPNPFGTPNAVLLVAAPKPFVALGSSASASRSTRPQTTILNHRHSSKGAARRSAHDTTITA